MNQQNVFATTAQLKELLGDSTTDESDFRDCSSIFDATIEEIDLHEEEYAPRQRNRGQSRTQTTSNRRTTKISFESTALPVNPNVFNAQCDISKTNLPDHITENSRPIDYFKLFVDDEVVTQMQRATNESLLEQVTRSQTETLSSGTGEFSLVVQGITNNDILVFLGVQLYMGIKRLPEEEDYFIKDKDDYTEPPLKHIMNYQQWLKIKKHFSIPKINLEGTNQWQYLAESYPGPHLSLRLNWYLALLNNKFKSFIIQGSVLSMDESMGLCKTQCSFTKRMKNKPIGEGIRVYMVVDSYCNYCVGLVVDNLDRGKKACEDSIIVIFNKLMAIVRPNALSLIIADNYYSSIKLANHLLSEYNLHYLGTLRSNRLGDIQLELLNQYTYGMPSDDIILLPFQEATEGSIKVYRVKDINEFLLITSQPVLMQSEVCLHASKINASQHKTFGLPSHVHSIIKQQALTLLIDIYNHTSSNAGVNHSLITGIPIV